MSLRASALPALKQCSQFQSGESSSFAIDGNVRHEALAGKFLEWDYAIPSRLQPLLAPESIEGIEWAFAQIQSRAEFSKETLKIEKEILIHDRNGDYWFPGHIDFLLGNQIFDFKWRRRNYREQMAGYALGLMQREGFDYVNCSLFFGECQEVQNLTFDLEGAFSIVESAANGKTENTVNDYCGWCKHKLTCPARLGVVQQLIKTEAPEMGSLEQLENNREDMSRALFAADIVKDWAEDIKSLALKESENGMQFPGFTLNKKQGRKEVADILGAFAASELTQREFLDCCEVSLNKLAYMTANRYKMSLRNARAEVEEKLNAYIQRKPDYYTLTKD